MRLGPEALERAQKKAFRLGCTLAEDIRAGKIYKKQRRRHEENKKYFQTLVKMYKDEWIHEYKYWEKKNRQNRGMLCPIKRGETLSVQRLSSPWRKASSRTSDSRNM